MTTDGIRHFWVMCQECDFLRHTCSNAPLLKSMHEDNNQGHFCLVLQGSPTKPYKYCMFKCEPYDSDLVNEFEHWDKHCLGNPDVLIAVGDKS